MRGFIVMESYAGDPWRIYKIYNVRYNTEQVAKALNKRTQAPNYVGVQYAVY